MSSNLAILGFRLKSSQKISFSGQGNEKNNGQNKVLNYSTVTQKAELKLPKIEVKTPKKLHPVNLPGVSHETASGIINGANKQGVSVDQYLRGYLKHLFWQPRVQAEPSITRQVGKTNVTTLIDGEQIFNKTIDMVSKAKKSIQVEMFEFQNLKVDGYHWPSNGAEVVPGFEQQQKLLSTIVKKKKENPNLKVQVILDAHKWYIDGNGYKRHYNNMDMIKYLKKNDIDVVPYPRASQQGTALQHVKMLAVDGRHAIIGGMNWGTHSVANHDACVALETLPNEKNSEVDNIIHDIFNKDWKFAWQRLGQTKFISGPLNKKEQNEMIPIEDGNPNSAMKRKYNGLRQEIKQENIDYMRVVGKLFDNPVDKNRFKEGRLDIIETKPTETPAIKVLGTKPRELAYIGEEGIETTRDFLKEKINNSKKVRAELFVFSDKELIENVVMRHKQGKLDAKFIVASEILEEFPYCRKAYDTLKKNNVPVRLYDFDERVNQRMHAKWAVFDDQELLIGSTNWSSMGLNSNLKKGQRGDYEMHAEKINEQIRGYLKEVKEHEKALGIPSITNKHLDYKELQLRNAKLRKAYAQLTKTGAGSFAIDKKEYVVDDTQKSTLATVIGYYDIINKRNNAKEKYKRGNNECAIAFKNDDIAKTFITQFDKDWIHSKNSLEDFQDREIDYRQPEEEQQLDVVG